MHKSLCVSDLPRGLDVDFDRVKNHHGPHGVLVEVIPDKGVQHGGVDDHLGPGEAQPGNEGVDGLGREASAPEGR